jgi:aminopeptidase YwaD
MKRTDAMTGEDVSIAGRHGDVTALTQRSEAYLHRLCMAISDRHVGSAGNREATAFFADTLASLGIRTESQVFDCIDWHSEGAHLTTGDHTFEAYVSPYSLGCHAHAPLVVVSSIEELETADAANKILLLRGNMAKEQLMPKNFPFYNPDEHKRIIGLLEATKPQALIAATARNPQAVGAVYPFPLIEDGDFAIPSVYMTEDEGSRLAEHAGKEASLDIKARRVPTTGCNVIGRLGAESPGRVVFFAHIDAKAGTPGALDNATGVVTLLLLAELLADYSGSLGVEIVAMNGEDHYANPGEMLYLQSEGKFAEIVLGVNLDGLGYHLGRTAYSLYDCPPAIAALIQKAFCAHADFVQGEPWYQGDHGLFLLKQRPALAITSECALELLSRVIHTPRDKPELVDAAKLVTTATALQTLALDLDRLLP